MKTHTTLPALRPSLGPRCPARFVRTGWAAARALAVAWVMTAVWPQSAARAQSFPPPSGEPTTESSPGTPPAPAEAREPTPRELGIQALQLYRMKDYRPAIRTAQKALEARPDQAEANLVMGAILALDNRGREAFPYLDRYTKSEAGRNDYQGYEILGDLFLKSNHNRMARDRFAEALARAPARERDEPIKARVQIKLAEALSGLAQHEQAIETARQAIADVPDSADYHWQLARIMARADRVPDAIVEMETAIRLLNADVQREFTKAQHDPEAEGALSKLQLTNEVYDMLQRTMLLAISRNPPDTADLYANVSRTLGEQANVERQIKLHEALAAAREAVKTNSKSPALWLNQAEREFAVGMGAAARKSLDEVFKLDPANAGAKRLLAQIEPNARPTTTTDASDQRP